VQSGLHNNRLIRMSLETYFRAFSYATIAVATLALTLAGGLPVYLTVLFLALMVAAWKFEGNKWQLSERTGLIVVLLSVPLFLLDWKFQNSIGGPAGRVGVNALAHLIIFLAAVKLLQSKKDRDWVFLYLISFFEVLLAAGLSFSPIFLGSLSVYLLCGLSTIIAFEIQKSKRTIAATDTHLLVPPDSGIFKNHARRSYRNPEVNRLPFVALMLLVLIFVLALPLFLVAPRSGAATLSRSGGGLTNLIGFSESVRLGEIGDLKRDNAVVMHVRLEEPSPGRLLRWRGVALDEFTGRGWQKSSAARHPTSLTNDRGFFQLGTTEALHRLTTQTIFLEPIESSVLFAASRPVAIQGNFREALVDGEGSVRARREFGRVMYKALSDQIEPDAALLQKDRRPYPETVERYLQLPRTLDPRIEGLANAMVANAHANNRYDTAKAIESQLQQDYGYSLQMRASGPDPLADFLFNVKAGHCEYFSTAMAVMLRTRKIPARVVNGFLPGEYNEAAGAYTVRQSDAHSWVEVYFPETQSWIIFDPTPMAGRTDPVRAGLTGQLEKYAEALQLMWLQYVVGYDKQEQRSLATALSNRLVDYRRGFASLILAVRRVAAAYIPVIALTLSALATVFILVLGVRRIRNFGWRRALSFSRPVSNADSSAIVFYERLTALLAQRGIKREPDLTPLEFASTLDLRPALMITRAYNRVRFGGQQLSAAELREIESTLNQLEGDEE
jgi:hypothetical protein